MFSFISPTSTTAVSLSPRLVQIVLAHLIRPVMTGLMHDGTDPDVLCTLAISIFIVILVVKDTVHAHLNIFLEQRPLPPPLWTDTPCPPTDLPLVLAVLESSSQPESDVPLEPTAGVVAEVDPSRLLPLRERLATPHAVFGQLRVIFGGGKVFLWRVELREP